MKLAPYARPETFDPNTCRYGEVDHGYEIDTPATRVALAIAKDIYRHANQAGIAPLVLAQLITDAVNESLRLREQRDNDVDPLGEALNSGNGTYRP